MSGRSLFTAAAAAEGAAEEADAAPACNIADRDGAKFEIDSFDLSGCNRTEFETALDEFERKSAGMAHRMETWPPAVQRRIMSAFFKWSTRDPSRVVVLQSTGLHRGVAVLIVHWIRK